MYNVCLLFLHTVEDLSVEVYPEQPKLDDILKLNIQYRVHLNNVEVFCTTPEKKRVEVKQISPPDYNNVVEAEIAIEGARNGQYKVTVASLLPDDTNYDSRKSTASESVDVECSGTTHVHMLSLLHTMCGIAYLYIL